MHAYPFGWDHLVLLPGRRSNRMADRRYRAGAPLGGQEAVTIPKRPRGGNPGGLQDAVAPAQGRPMCAGSVPLDRGNAPGSGPQVEGLGHRGRTPSGLLPHHSPFLQMPAACGSLTLCLARRRRRAGGGVGRSRLVASTGARSPRGRKAINVFAGWMLSSTHLRTSVSEERKSVTLGLQMGAMFSTSAASCPRIPSNRFTSSRSRCSASVLICRARSSA